MATAAPIRLMNGVVPCTRVLLVRPAETVSIVQRAEASDQTLQVGDALTERGKAQASVIGAALADLALRDTPYMKAHALDWRLRHVSILVCNEARSAATAAAIADAWSHKWPLDAIAPPAAVDAKDITVQWLDARRGPSVRPHDQDPMRLDVVFIVAPTAEYVAIAEALFGLGSARASGVQLAPGLGAVTFGDVLATPTGSVRALLHAVGMHTLPDTLCWDNKEVV